MSDICILMAENLPQFLDDLVWTSEDRVYSQETDKKQKFHHVCLHNETFAFASLAYFRLQGSGGPTELRSKR